jgi:hypothetical protein
VKDVGEGRRDDGAEAVVGQGPRRVLAGGSAAEIRAREKDRGVTCRGMIELERRIGRAVGTIAPVEEQRRTEAGALDALQKLLGDDLVGIHVRAIERRDRAGVHDEGFHGCHPERSEGSTRA